MAVNMARGIITNFFQMLPPESCINVFQRLDGCDLLNLSKAYPQYKELIFDYQTIRYLSVRSKNVSPDDMVAFLKEAGKRQCVETLDITGLYWIKEKLLTNCISRMVKLRDLQCISSSMTLVGLSIGLANCHVETLAFRLAMPSREEPLRVNLLMEAFKWLKNVTIYLERSNNRKELCDVFKSCVNLEYLLMYVEASCKFFVQSCLVNRPSLKEFMVIGEMLNINLIPTFRDWGLCQAVECNLGHLYDTDISGFYLTRSTEVKQEMAVLESCHQFRFGFKKNVVNVSHPPHSHHQVLMDIVKQKVNFALLTSYASSACVFTVPTPEVSPPRLARTGLGPNASPPNGNKLQVFVAATPNMRIFELVGCCMPRPSTTFDGDLEMWNEYVLQEICNWKMLTDLSLLDVHFYNVKFLEKIRDKCNLVTLTLQMHHSQNIFPKIVPIVKSMVSLRDLIYDQSTYTVRKLSDAFEPVLTPTFIERYHCRFAGVLYVNRVDEMRISPTVHYIGGKFNLKHEYDLKNVGLLAAVGARDPKFYTFFEGLPQVNRCTYLPLIHRTEILQRGRTRIPVIEIRSAVPITRYFN